MSDEAVVVLQDALSTMPSAWTPVGQARRILEFVRGKGFDVIRNSGFVTDWATRPFDKGMPDGAEILAKRIFDLASSSANSDATEEMKKTEERIASMVRDFSSAKREHAHIPMRLHCPECGDLHIDSGEFATKPHHTHACQSCGNVWRPAVVHTVGVQFLPGFKNESEADQICDALCASNERLLKIINDLYGKLGLERKPDEP